jgi:hypothetical protein
LSFLKNWLSFFTRANRYHHLRCSCGALPNQESCPAETLGGFFVGVWAMAKVLGVLVAVLVAWGSVARADEQGCWQALENNPSCSVWNAYPKPSETVTWSGARWAHAGGGLYWA